MLNAQEIRWFCRDNLSPRPLLFPLLYLFPTSSLPLPLSLFAPFTSPIFTTLCRFLLPLPPPSSPSTRCSLCWVFVFWVQLFLPTSTVMSLGGSDICGFDVQCGVDSFSLPQSPYNMVGGTDYSMQIALELTSWRPTQWKEARFSHICASIHCHLFTSIDNLECGEQVCWLHGFYIIYFCSPCLPALYPD